MADTRTHTHLHTFVLTQQCMIYRHSCLVTALVSWLLVAAKVPRAKRNSECGGWALLCRPGRGCQETVDTGPLSWAELLLAATVHTVHSDAVVGTRADSYNYSFPGAGPVYHHHHHHHRHHGSDNSDTVRPVSPGPAQQGPRVRVGF